MKQMNSMKKHGYNPHQQAPFSNRTMANINGTSIMETHICQNYQQMKVKHTLLHSALAYQNLWMIKSTMPFHWHSPHDLMVYHNLASYLMMTMMKWMKYSSTHLLMCIRMNSQINVFDSANQQNLPNLFCMKLLKSSSSYL